jgi:HPr kinase/phosphorylase
LASATATSIEARELLGEAAGLRLVVLAGEAGLHRRIGSHRVQKPGLALAGFVRQVHPERVQVLGETELAYLNSLPMSEARHGVETFMMLEPACILVTKGLDVPPFVIEVANRARVPVLRTPIVSSLAIEAVQTFIEHRLAARGSLHGVLMDVLGVGVLILGKSGAGKSEAALELVMRGHRLVADDLVEVRRTAGEVIVGSASELIKHHMEVRGLGIINIKDMFGVAAVRDEKRIELVLELVPQAEQDATDRLGLGDLNYAILDVPLPMLRIPVSPGRNVSSLIEVAARNRLLQVRGHHSAREFQEKLDQALADAIARRGRDEVE